MSRILVVDNLFFFISKKLYKNPFLSIEILAILSDIRTSDTSSVVTGNIALRKYDVLLWHELCALASVYSCNGGLLNEG